MREICPQCKGWGTIINKCYLIVHKKQKCDFKCPYINRSCITTSIGDLTKKRKESCHRCCGTGWIKPKDKKTKRYPHN